MGAGRRVSAAQIRELRRHLNERSSLNYAAMKAGMDRKTARKYRQGAGAGPTAHLWRTRADPLAEVWPRVEELLQREPKLQAKTLVEWLEQEYPGQDWQRPRRTLERRVRQWRAEHGPAKEVFFRQVHEPGRLGSSDFTRMGRLEVTIQGQSFAHLIYHFVLTYSNWEHVSLCFSESFASLSAGVQNALGDLGGAPERHRTDRMTLAVNHEGSADQYTAKYQALLGHYGLTAEATNPASGHENGDCEQGHRRFKEELDQALLLRGSRDFGSRAEYWSFVLALVGRRNARRQEKFAEEQARLRPLPAQRLETLEQQRPRVGQGSTIQVKKNTYSVPARLIGERVEARIGADQIEVWYAGSWVQTMERLRGQGKHRIDYRHVIDWLVRKPGAFARYMYRAELYPSVTFRRAYDTLQAQQPARADREYVRLLHLAAHDGESRVEESLNQLLEQRQPLSEQVVRTLLGKDTPLSVAAQVSVAAVDLRQYDALLEGGAAMSDMGMSNTEPSQEVNHEPGQGGGADALPAGAAFGGGAEPVRGGGATGDGRVVGLHGVPAGTDAARVPAAAAQPDRASAEGLEAVAGEELVGTGPEASADEGGAATAESIERGLSGPARERAGLWAAGFGEDARLERAVVGPGACRPAGTVHEVQPAGAGTAEGETGPGPEGSAAGTVALGRPGDRRPGLRATEPRGDGGTVHAVGGALRAGQRAGDKQPGVLALGADIQGPDDDGGRDRPAGAPQRDCGAQRAKLSRRGGEADTRRTTAEGGLREGDGRPGCGPGYATVVVATLLLPPLRQAHTPARFATPGWGILIVAHGEG
jgi:hypothetical protein